MSLRARGIRRVFQLPWRSRGQVAEEVDDELAHHLAEMEAALRNEGWAPDDARVEAQRRFGDVEFTRAFCRAEDLRREQEKRRMTMLEELGQDLRYAIRALRVSPGFTITALLTLALGIGANTAIFSVVRGVLLQPLPFPEPDRIVRVWDVNAAAGVERGSFSEPDFLDLQRESQLASSIGAYFFASGLSGLDLTGQGSPERLSAALVTDGFFQTLGTRALLGRTLATEEHVPGSDRVAVISYGLWKRRFGANPSVVGSTISLNSTPFVVAGVMPEGFTYPADQTLDVWIPLSFFGPESIGRARGARFLSVIARLKSGVSETQFRSEIASGLRRLAEQYPEADAGWTGAATLNLRDSILGEVRPPLLVLMFAVVMLLLIACVNIANLLLARGSGRQRELAVRAALGAGRGRIARQLLTESLTLAVLGGVLGIAFGAVAVRVLAAGTAELPRATDIRIDGGVLLFTLVVAVAAGLLFGLMPALRASSPNLERTLRSGTRGSVGVAGQTMRSALVVIEVALAVILVVGAGLATKSFARLLAVRPGFEPSNALVVMMSVPDRYTTRDARKQYYLAVLDALRNVRGVTAAGAVRDLPLRANGEMGGFTLPGQPIDQEGTIAEWHQTSTDFFKAMAIPLKAGRSFTLADADSAPLVVVVNEELARRSWPGESPASAVGKRIMAGTMPFEIIGVVGDVRQRGLADPVEPTIYLHAMQSFRVRMSIVVRTNGDPLSYANAVREAIWRLDPNQTITGIMTLESVLGSAVARPRLLAWLLALFGAIGLTLGALGIFGVLAYAVNQRRQEIGVRVALGATPRSVLSLIVGRGMLLALGGVVTGIVGAFLLTRSMQSVLYDIRPSDPITFAEVVIVLLGSALLASWLPARRAMAIDPVTALRYD